MIGPPLEHFKAREMFFKVDYVWKRRSLEGLSICPSCGKPVALTQSSLDEDYSVA